MNYEQDFAALLLWKERFKEHLRVAKQWVPNWLLWAFATTFAPKNCLQAHKKSVHELYSLPIYSVFLIQIRKFLIRKENDFFLMSKIFLWFFSYPFFLMIFFLSNFFLMAMREKNTSFSGKIGQHRCANGNLFI